MAEAEAKFSFTKEQMNDLLKTVVSNTLLTTWAAKVNNLAVCKEEHLSKNMSHATMEIYLKSTFPALARLRKDIIIPNICLEAGLPHEDRSYDMRELEQSLADSDSCLVIHQPESINELEEVIKGTQDKRADRSKKSTTTSLTTSTNNESNKKDSINRISYLKFIGECYKLSDIAILADDLCTNEKVAYEKLLAEEISLFLFMRKSTFRSFKEAEDVEEHNFLSSEVIYADLHNKTAKKKKNKNHALNKKRKLGEDFLTPTSSRGSEAIGTNSQLNVLGSLASASPHRTSHRDALASSNNHSSTSSSANRAASSLSNNNHSSTSPRAALASSNNNHSSTSSSANRAASSSSNNNHSSTSPRAALASSNNNHSSTSHRAALASSNNNHSSTSSSAHLNRAASSSSNNYTSTSSSAHLNRAASSSSSNTKKHSSSSKNNNRHDNNSHDQSSSKKNSSLSKDNRQDNNSHDQSSSKKNSSSSKDNRQDNFSHDQSSFSEDENPYLAEDGDGGDGDGGDEHFL